ncbi:MAG: hypothetical protein KKB82_07555 [Candidatus Omnitrophica bacterium]|nr:hypothetical protein [Candidatus Omnitrophota bacterium]
MEFLRSYKTKSIDSSFMKDGWIILRPLPLLSFNQWLIKRCVIESVEKAGDI